MKPMLLSNYKDHVDYINNQDYVFIQPKIDGWRCIIDTWTGTLYSRKGNVIMLPHISADVQYNNNRYLDGELYCDGFTCNQIMSMIKKQDTRIKFYCFDVISNKKYSDRLKDLVNVKETKNVRQVMTYKITTDMIDTYYQEYLSMGLEGAVVRFDEKYEQFRSQTIFKIKPIYD